MTQPQTPQMPPADPPVWHYMVGAQQVGPVPLATMYAMIQSGAITSATMVWRQGMAGWLPAGGVPDFAFALQGAANPINSALSSKKEAALGLNTSGLVLFIVLLLVCIPLCWLPWVIDGTRAK